jgi:hypothetical protein
MEIIITLAIVFAAGIIFYRSVKKKASGKCDCGECGGNCSGCSVYKKE